MDRTDRNMCYAVRYISKAMLALDECRVYLLPQDPNEIAYGYPDGELGKILERIDEIMSAKHDLEKAKKNAMWAISCTVERFP